MLKIKYTKNQHYVSQGILKSFSDKNNKVYELYIPNHVVSQKPIRKTMSQNYVYEHPQLRKNQLEIFFGMIESTTIPILDSIIDDLDSTYNKVNEIDIFKKRIIDILPYILVFYFRSGALLTEYSSYSEMPKEIRVERMLLNILDGDYILGISETIKQFYDVSILVDEKSRFIISDQYLSTAALKYKNKFSNASNRQIGMKETMILLPLSKKFYMAFYNGQSPNFIK